MTAETVTATGKAILFPGDIRTKEFNPESVSLGDPG